MGKTKATSTRAKQLAPPLPPAPSQADATMLVVSLGQQYGKKRYYAENSTSRLFLTLLRQKSFDPRDLDLIKLLGYRVILRPRSMDDTEL